MRDLSDLTIAGFAEGFRRGEWTSEAVTAAVLERIGRVEKTVHAYVTVDAEGALEAARQRNNFV